MSDVTVVFICIECACNKVVMFDVRVVLICIECACNKVVMSGII